jgi:hypothetical protein
MDQRSFWLLTNREFAALKRRFNLAHVIKDSDSPAISAPADWAKDRETISPGLLLKKWDLSESQAIDALWLRTGHKIGRPN